MDPDHRRTTAYEADRAAEREARLPAEFRTDVPRDEVVASQRLSDYTPAVHLSSAAPALAARLREHLRELWEFNEEWVGERTREAEAYFAATGESAELRRRVLEWCRDYFINRVGPGRLTARNRRDPFLLAQEVNDEWARIFGTHTERTRSLNYIFLSNTRKFTRWLVFEWLRQSGILERTETGVQIRGDWNREAQDTCVRHADHGGWLKAPSLDQFLPRVRHWAAPSRVAELRSLGRESLLERVSRAADDIRVTRPLLTRNFHPHKTAVVLAPDCHVMWSWSISGLGSLIVGDSERTMRENYQRSWSDFGVLVGPDGLFCPTRMPWWTTVSCDADAGGDAVALNCLLLEQFRDTLVSFYDRIGPTDAAAESDLSPRGEWELAIGVRERVAVTDVEPALPIERKLRSVLRMTRFLSALEKCGATVERGQGSEIKVNRSGARPYLLGRHKPNPEIVPAVAARVLKRLGIAVETFLSKVR